MLLNRVLTVQPGAPASHKGWGWETVTQRAIEALVERRAPLVAILWGASGAVPDPHAGLDADPGLAAPLPAQRLARLLRLAPLQPRQRAPGRAGGGAGGLAPALNLSRSGRGPARFRTGRRRSLRQRSAIEDRKSVGRERV